MKKGRLFLLTATALLVLLTCACEKDYRMGWMGQFGYDVTIKSWIEGDSSITVRYESGNLFVEESEDSCVMITLSDSTWYWRCQVYSDGNLKLIESSSYCRHFDGHFSQSDSLYINCSYGGLGGGVSREYRCKKK